MQIQLSDPNVKGLECRHVTYCESKDGQSDLMVVKEYIHYHDGRVEPNLRMIPNYKREFWVTKPGHQNHKDKKEWEKESRCQRFTSIQIKLKDAVGRALNNPGAPGGLRMLARSPYLYGTDINVGALVKNDYNTQYPDCVTPEAKVAVLDIESDVVHGHGDILSISLTFKDKAILGVTKDFLGTIQDAGGKINKAMTKYLSKYVQERNIDLTVFIGDTPSDVIREVVGKAHEWQPDFVAFWNMNYDLPYIVKQLDKEGVDPADIFSDPRVPAQYRFYKYKEGPSQKKTAKGKILPLHPAERWHVATFPASWYAIDAMCLYKRLRIVKGNEPNYSLDGVLGRNLGERKLKFDDLLAEKYPTVQSGSLKWHQVMQAEYKIEYLIYNLFDCIGVELLDEKTGDISKAFHVQAGASDYNDFSSNPRRICDDLHFVCREKGLVIAATSDQMVDELDKYVVSMDGWIVTLPSYLVDDNGLPLIEEAPHLNSKMRIHVADLDIEGTYPNEEVIMNISKETTQMELYRIEGVPEPVQRSIGVNLTAGPVNAIEISQRVFGMPTSETLLREFEKELAMDSSQKEIQSV